MERGGIIRPHSSRYHVQVGREELRKDNRWTKRFTAGLLISTLLSRYGIGNSMENEESMQTLTASADDGPGSTPSSAARPTPLPLTVTERPDVGIYEGAIDGLTVAGVVFSRSGNNVTLLATSVLPRFRGRGIAGQLLATVLDKLRDEGATATLSCPFAVDFAATHPQYADVVAYPGSKRRP